MSKQKQQTQKVLSTEMKVDESAAEKGENLAGDSLNQTKKSIRQKGGTYFYSSAIINKKNVFVTPEYLDLLVNAFRLAELKKDIKNLAYVVMPNHFYWVFRLSENQENPTDIYRYFKQEVTLPIIKNLCEEAKEDDAKYEILDIFKENDNVQRSHPRKTLWEFKQEAKKFDKVKRYKVWDPKASLFLLDDNEKLVKNLKMVQEAPVRERWQLVEDSADYPYLYISDEAAEKLAT